jgi:hypothetical protein
MLTDDPVLRKALRIVEDTLVVRDPYGNPHEVPTLSFIPDDHSFHEVDAVIAKIKRGQVANQKALRKWWWLKLVLGTTLALMRPLASRWVQVPWIILNTMIASAW